MGGLPPLTWFPAIDMDGETLRALLVLFRKIRLLQPSFSVAGPTTEEAEARGWVEIHRPLPLDLDGRGARALMEEYERWGKLHQDSGYLAYLKHGGGHLLEEEPGFGLVREIREYGKRPTNWDEQETLRGQILLQMAQDLDRQRIEIRELLEDLGRREAAMLRSLGMDEEGEESSGSDAEPLPSVEEDDFLIPQRLRAWGELLRGAGEARPSLLLTQNRIAVEHLLEWSMEKSGGGMESPAVLLQICIPWVVPNDLEETGRFREAIAGDLPWRLFCEKMEALAEEARGMALDEGGRKDLMTRGRALASYFQENASEAIMERIAVLEPSWGGGWLQCRLALLLVPDRSEVDLLIGKNVDRPGPPNGLILQLDRSSGEDAPRRPGRKGSGRKGQDSP
jgi:hypothetical protein